MFGVDEGWPSVVGLVLGGTIANLVMEPSSDVSSYMYMFFCIYFMILAGSFFLFISYFISCSLCTVSKVPERRQCLVGVTVLFFLCVREIFIGVGSFNEKRTEQSRMKELLFLFAFGFFWSFVLCGFTSSFSVLVCGWCTIAKVSSIAFTGQTS